MPSALWNAFEWGFTPGFRLHVDLIHREKDEGDNFFQGAHPGDLMIRICAIGSRSGETDLQASILTFPSQRYFESPASIRLLHAIHGRALARLGSRQDNLGKSSIDGTIESTEIKALLISSIVLAKMDGLFAWAQPFFMKWLIGWKRILALAGAWPEQLVSWGLLEPYAGSGNPQNPASRAKWVRWQPLRMQQV